MSNNENIEPEDINKNDAEETINTDAATNETEESTENVSTEEKMAEIQDKYLRLSAEFDNYRKRTLKERYELIKTASEDTIQGLLPIIDDFDRAINAMNKLDDASPEKQGMLLIYDKLIAYLKSKGLNEIDVLNKDFDTDTSEAVAKFATEEKDKKGKVIDVAQKGYVLNDKVVRYAKVIVGD